MDKIELVQGLLEQIGMPQRQQSTLCCLTLLAMANIKPNGSFEDATNEWLRIHDIIVFLGQKYEKFYAVNSRETFRKQAIHHFRIAALIEDNGKATNSPNYRYRITDEFLKVIKSIKDEGHSRFKYGENPEILNFMNHHQSLKEIYASKKKMQKMPVKINNNDYTFSSGKHNQLQKAILEDFAPLFAPHSECLYVGDTTKKDLVKNVEKLKALGFNITLHDKMPDVVLYRADKNWLYFIEAVTSVGPIDPKRIFEINQMTSNVSAGKIFITAFLDFKTFNKFSESLAWETEVWIADHPTHMIHMNGDKFMGPRD